MDRWQKFIRRLYGADAPATMVCYGELHMSYVLWAGSKRHYPEFEETGETVAFNLRPGEIPIFQTGNCVTYAEERAVTNHGRTYQGLSLPVGGGVYYHIGGSQGHQERTSGLLPLDGGKILITSPTLCFGGQTKTFRIQLDHVLRQSRLGARIP